jgi:hypothetical protein
VIFSLAIVVAAGLIVYFIQRARGVDIGATIHEIDESPADAMAAEGMAAGMSGKMLPPAGPVAGMGVDPAADKGDGTTF